MAYSDLREFIGRLEREGELVRISEPVDPILEISEITDRVSKRVGPALLFENVKGYDIPVLINALGSPRRMNLALQVDSLEQVAGRMRQLLDLKSPEGLVDKIRMLPKLAELGSFFPKAVRTGACKEIVRRDGLSLNSFPVLQCWPQDGGRTITFPLVFSKNPATGKRNCGIYRMQVYDDTTAGMHWQIHKHGAAHGREHSRLASERMEVAVAIGADPAVCFSACMPLPDDFDEMMFAGFLRGKPVEMVRAETVDVEVPASAEMVLEGHVSLAELRTEGPFGDHTGFYSLPDPYPVFHLQCVTHRRNPIYHTTLVGIPPMEDCHMAKAIERVTLPVVQKQLPEIVDMHLPFEGVFHNLMILSIRKAYPGHARKVMNAIWGLGQAMFSKCILVVDDDTNIQDLREVTWKVLNNIDPQRDIEFVMGPIDVLDHSSRFPQYGSKMGVDATRKWPNEGFSRPWPEPIRMCPEVQRRIDVIWKQLKIDGS
ncbi:MAG: menaquinone biosynthesis decarboxylase [Acidobacteria bacterium]|nr:menaquinone biosynthesis decarboxylase [Acidobacteriota bacterium]